MSRSRRKTPIISITVRGHRRGEKADKQRWHRAWRRAARAADDAGEFDGHRNHSNPWAMAKDGRRWLGWGMPARLWRK